jgi:hypothetical protein
MMLVQKISVILLLVVSIVLLLAVIIMNALKILAIITQDVFTSPLIVMMKTNVLWNIVIVNMVANMKELSAMIKMLALKMLVIPKPDAILLM